MTDIQKSNLKHAILILLIPIAFAIGLMIGKAEMNYVLPFGFSWQEVTVVGQGSVTESGDAVHGFLLIDNEHEKEYLVCDDGVVPLNVDEVENE